MRKFENIFFVTSFGFSIEHLLRRTLVRSKVNSAIEQHRQGVYKLTQDKPLCESLCLCVSVVQKTNPYEHIK